MKVKIFQGTSLDIEAQINEWVKEAQPLTLEDLVLLHGLGLLLLEHIQKNILKIPKIIE